MSKDIRVQCIGRALFCFSLLYVASDIVHVVSLQDRKALLRAVCFLTKWAAVATAIVLGTRGPAVAVSTCMALNIIVVALYIAIVAPSLRGTGSLHWMHEALNHGGFLVILLWAVGTGYVQTPARGKRAILAAVVTGCILLANALVEDAYRKKCGESVYTTTVNVPSMRKVALPLLGSALVLLL